MLTRLTLSIVIFLQVVPMCCASDRLRTIKELRKSRVVGIKEFREDCKRLLELYSKVEAAQTTFEQMFKGTSRKYVYDECNYNELDDRLSTNAWKNFQHWVAAQSSRQQRFLQHRNNEQDVAVLYGILKPAEVWMQQTLDDLYYFNKHRRL